MHNDRRIFVIFGQVVWSSSDKIGVLPEGIVSKRYDSGMVGRKMNDKIGSVVFPHWYASKGWHEST
jgi:hypothetical protein